jgi:hypothetical protein
MFSFGMDLRTMKDAALKFGNLLAKEDAEGQQHEECRLLRWNAM